MKQYIVDAFTDDILAATGGLAQEAYFEEGDMIVVVPSEEDLARFVPNYPAMEKLEGRGLILTAPSKDFDFVY